VLIAVAFGTSLAQAVTLPAQIDNWENPFTSGTITAANGPVTQTGITSNIYFGGVTRTATIVNSGSGTSSATIVPNVLNFNLTAGGSSLTLEYQFGSTSVSFEDRRLAAFFRNASPTNAYTVDVSYQDWADAIWHKSGTFSIVNEPVLEEYSLSLGSGATFVRGVQIIYSSQLSIDDGGLCSIRMVPEIDPATGSSALSLVAGVLAMIEQRRRRATLVA
jgi:hypothetical protein